MQKRASAVKNWIACKIDQPRVGKSLERLAETRLRGPTVNVASFALPCPPASHFSPRRLCFLFRGPILIPPLITLYHACTCRFLAHGRQNIILVSNMMHDFRSRNYASRFQDGIFFISPRCEYRVVSNPNRA